MIPETIERLKNSDRAVSPVIGVILMVAITVILAAVIAAFVLGFGADTEAPPQASIDMDVDGDTDEVTVEVLSTNDPIDSANLYLRGDGVNSEYALSDGSYGDLNGGDIITINHNVTSGTVNLVWDSGDESSTLASGEA